MKPYYDHGGITIYHGDCREILPTLPKADLVLTDPPYGIGASKRGRGGQHGGKALAPSRDYGDSNWDMVRIEWITEILSTKNQIVWGGNYYADLLGPSRGWLVWDKETGENTYADAELAWTNLDIAVRLKRFQWKGMFTAGEKEDRHHPTQKPTSIMLWCLSFAEGDVIDPFMGNGTTLRAAKDTGRKAIGIEIEEPYCEIAAKRLQQEVFDFSGSKP